jgi:hypothetical protein
MEQCSWCDMRKLSTDKAWEKCMSQSFIYECEKEEIRWKKVDKNVVVCWRHYRESRVTACGCLQLGWRGREVAYNQRQNYNGSL